MIKSHSLTAGILIWSCILSVGTFFGCRFRSNSKQKDLDVSVAHGFMRPFAPEELYFKGKVEGVALNEFAYVLQLDPTEVQAKNSRMVLAANGESMLVVDPEDNFPVPAFSTVTNKDTGKKDIAQWTELIFAENDQTRKLNLFVKHSLESAPEYKTEAIYALRFPFSSSGLVSPVLVPWTRHFRDESGHVFYRIGNSIISTITNEAVLQFQPIGRYVWRSWGIYNDTNVCSGTIFWNQLKNGQPTDTIWSYSKGQPKVTKWHISGSYMTLAEQTSVLELEIPSIVHSNLSACDVFSEQNPPRPLGLDMNLVDPELYVLSGGEWNGGSGPVLLPAKSPSSDVTAFDAQYQYEGEFLSKPSSSSRLADLSLNEAIKPFSVGVFYQPGAKFQVSDGTIHQVLRTTEHIGWFANFYTYDTVNYSADEDGKIGRISYKLDASGRIVEKKHLRTFASEIAKDIRQINNEKASDVKVIASQLDSNRSQLKQAEIMAGQVDSIRKLTAMTVSNYAYDQIGRKFGSQVFNKNISLASRLKNAGVVAANSTAMTGLLDWANSPNKTMLSRAQMVGITSLTAGSAWAVYAASDGMARIAFIAGVGTEGAYLIQQRALGYNVPSWLQTGGRLVIGGTSAASQAAIMSQAQSLIASQGLTGTAAQSAIDQARLKIRALCGVADIARLYFQDNLTVSAGAGAALETAVGMIPSDPVTGIPKAMGQTLARQTNALFQLSESMIRNQRTSVKLDEALAKLRNKEALQGSIAVMQSLDGGIFNGLESGSNGSSGVPSVIQEAMHR